jgi:lipoprotein NlpD
MRYTVLLFGWLLTACGGNTYAPVSDRSMSVQSDAAPSEYVVRKGDTLYAIAFRYGLDYRELAAANNINGQYSIYPGQSLGLIVKKPSPGSASIVRDVSTHSPKPIIASTQHKAPSKSVAPNGAVTKKAPVAIKEKPISTPKKPAPSKASTIPASAVKIKVQTKQPSVVVWKWPVYGNVVGRFKTKGTINKGINIAGKKGLSIKAAASGKVVYAGNGLLGYGNLVIVDHNQQFLSAYAHNSRVLVKENDMVKTGDKIAEMGSSGADRVMLHFEIRRDGKPVDPLRYLPKR